MPLDPDTRNGQASLKCLDLFCGAGGASMGLHRAGFEVTGVDIRPQPNYPFRFCLGNALYFDLSGFDLVWASPPCQAYVQRNKNLNTKWPKLIEPIRKRLQESGIPYIIENVEGAPLHNPTLLCGTMFGLKVRRHRLFEHPLFFVLPPTCNHWGRVSEGTFAGVYAFGARGRRRGKGKRDPKCDRGPNWAESMGIDWMNKDELREAIPPAYSEFLGRCVIQNLYGTPVPCVN